MIACAQMQGGGWRAVRLSGVPSSASPTAPVTRSAAHAVSAVGRRAARRVGLTPRPVSHLPVHLRLLEVVGLRLVDLAQPQLFQDRLDHGPHVCARPDAVPPRRPALVALRPRLVVVARARGVGEGRVPRQRRRPLVVELLSPRRRRRSLADRAALVRLFDVERARRRRRRARRRRRPRGGEPRAARRVARQRRRPRPAVGTQTRAARCRGRARRGGAASSG